MIVVDSSAIVAIILAERLADDLRQRLMSVSPRHLSAANYVECGQVLAQRISPDPLVGLAVFDEFVSRAALRIEPIDEVQARVALEARIRYGRGFGHRAHLNYSDCFAYALAKTRNLPLLFVGDDFSHTDIVSALA